MESVQGDPLDRHVRLELGGICRVPGKVHDLEQVSDCDLGASRSYGGPFGAYLGDTPAGATHGSSRVSDA